MDGLSSVLPPGSATSENGAEMSKEKTSSWLNRRLRKIRGVAAQTVYLQATASAADPHASRFVHFVNTSPPVLQRQGEKIQGVAAQTVYCPPSNYRGEPTFSGALREMQV